MTGPAPAEDGPCVVAHDPAWAARFRVLAERARAGLGALAVTVEHVGSTAVPGLAAKPVLDLDVVVRAADLARAVALLERLGYRHQGDRGIPGREAFRWPPGEARHHLYLCPEDSPELRRHLRFRDRLRADPAAALAYGALKRRLAERHAADRQAYQDGKAAFIEGVLGHGTVPRASDRTSGTTAKPKERAVNGPVDLTEVFAGLAREGRPEQTAVLGGVNIRLVRVAGGGPGRWDSHGHTAETVVVWSGDFKVEFRDHTLELGPGQCCVVPAGAEHRGTSRDGAEVVLFTQAG